MSDRIDTQARATAAAIAKHYNIADARTAYALVRAALLEVTGEPRPPVQAAPPPVTTGAFFPFGRNKGEPIAGAAIADLYWLARSLEQSINDPTRSRWRADNEALLQAARDEIARQEAKENE